jgi:hypothetical protein
MMENKLMMTLVRIIFLTMLGSTLLCSVVLAQEQEHHLAACKADVEKFCSDQPKGQHKIRPCLESNKDKLSTECRTALDSSKNGKHQQ